MANIIGRMGRSGGGVVGRMGGSTSKILEQKINDLDDRVDTIITTPVEGVSAQEIIDARGGEATLGSKISTVSAELAKIPNNGVEFGGIQTNGNNNAIKIQRTMSGDNKFGHAIADDSLVNSQITGAYASFDSNFKVEGATNYNHMTAHQARAEYAGSGTMGQSASFDSNFRHTGTGLVNNHMGLKINKPTLLNTGKIDVLYGIFIDALSEGNTNLAIYSLCEALSYFKGPIRTDGTLTGANFYTDIDKLNVGIGANIPLKALGAFYNTCIGSGAGQILQNNANFNTLIGANAGNSLTTGSDNICIGKSAGTSGNGSNNVLIGNNTGYWGIGNGNVLVGNGSGKYNAANGNLFIVTNGEKADAVKEETESLIYGKFDSSMTNQFLTVNGKLNVAKDIESTKIGGSVILKSPNGSKWAIKVSDTGVISATAV